MEATVESANTGEPQAEEHPSSDVIETEYFEVPLPESWVGRVEIDYGSDYTTVIDTANGIELCTFIMRDSDTERLATGDIGYSWVGEKDGTQEKIVEVWAYRWPFLLWNEAMGNTHEYESMTDAQKAEIIELVTGGTLEADDLFSVTDYESASELFFLEDEYLQKALIDPMVVY